MGCNGLQVLPPSLGHLPALRLLDTEGNPLGRMPLAAAAALSDPAAAAAWFRAKYGPRHLDQEPGRRGKAEVLVLGRDVPSVGDACGDEVVPIEDGVGAGVDQDTGHGPPLAFRGPHLESDLLPPNAAAAMEARMAPVRPVTDDDIDAAPSSSGPGSSGRGATASRGTTPELTRQGSSWRGRPDSALGRSRPTTQAQVSAGAAGSFRSNVMACHVGGLLHRAWRGGQQHVCCARPQMLAMHSSYSELGRPPTGRPGTGTVHSGREAGRGPPSLATPGRGSSGTETDGQATLASMPALTFPLFGAMSSVARGRSQVRVVGAGGAGGWADGAGAGWLLSHVHKFSPASRSSGDGSVTAVPAERAAAEGRSGGEDGTSDDVLEVAASVLSRHDPSLAARLSNLL